MQSGKQIIYLISPFFLFFVLLQTLAAQPQQEKPDYLDSTQPVKVRVEDLLERMTIEEKIGQLNMPCVYENGLGESVEAKFDGSRSGKEVVQLYINDLYATVSRPVKELKGFEKISIAAGETKTVTFKLTPEHLQMLDRHLNWVVEPGEFKVMISSSSDDIRLSGRIFCK